MNVRGHRIVLLLSLVFLANPLYAETEITVLENSIVEQIYQLTVQSKKYVEADLIDSALISACMADSLARSRDTRGDSTTAAAYNNLAYCHYRNETIETALAYLDSALTTLRQCKTAEDSLLADIHVNYGRIYDQLSEYGKAIESYEKALDIQEVVLGRDHTEVGTISNNLAIVKMYVGQYEEAEKLLFTAMEIWRAVLGPEHADVGLCLFNLGYLYDDLGRYDDAERCYLESLAIREEALGPDHSSIGFICVNIASLQAVLGKDDLALETLNKAHDIIGMSLGQRSIYYAQVSASIASILINSHGNYAEGESLIREALSICAETLGRDHSFAASLYTRLADYNSLFGKRDAALEYHKKASEIVLKVYGKNSIEYALAMASVAFAYSQLMGHYDSPEMSIDSLYEEYRAVISECGTSKVNDYNASLREFGGAMYNCGRYEESAQLLRMYVANKEQYHDCLPVRGAIALLSFMMGHDLEALAAAKELAVLVAGADDLTWRSRAYCHIMLSELYLFAGYSEDALEHTKKANDYQDLFLRNAFSNASQATKIALLNHSTFMSFLPTKLDDISTPEATALALKHAMMEKSYVIDAISHEHEFIQCSDEPSLQNICDAFVNLSARTASLVRASISEYDQSTSQELIRSLTQERDSLETIISNVCSDYNPGLSTDEFGVEDIVGRLEAGDILIEYIRFLSTDSLVPETILRQNRQFNYGAFILDSDGGINFRDLGPARIIDSLIAGCREHISKTGTKALTTLGPVIEQQLFDIDRVLYQKILDPFAELLDGKNHLIVAPARNIYLVPFDILPTGENRYLLEDYQVSYVSSGMDLLADKDTDSNHDGPIVVFANPDYDLDLQSDAEAADNPAHEVALPDQHATPGAFRDANDCSLAGFERLPYAVEEMKSIEDLVTKHTGKQILIYTGDLARERTLTSLNQEPSALHFATHGFICIPEYQGFEDRHILPMFQSGLALAGANNKPNLNRAESSDSYEDGILSAYEVSALNLTGTDLVVLSACESGVGEYVNGMGVMGLRSSFRQAGAKSVIMSLWKVPDDLSASIMKGFYKRWLTGESKIGALRETSLELLRKARKQYGNGHPIHWSGFILAGKSQ